MEIDENDACDISLNLNPASVMKLILQYCKENNLIESLNCLQLESGIRLNSVDSIERFKQDVIKGRWNVILKDLNGLDINGDVLYDLCEQIVFDLIENDDREVANYFLNKMGTKSILKLDKLVSYINYRGSIKEIYLKENFNKEMRRFELSVNLSNELLEIPFERLNTLLKNGVKFECKQNKLLMENFDIIRGINLKQNKEQTIEKSTDIPSIIVNKRNSHLYDIELNSSYVKNEFKKLIFDSSSYIEVAKFSYNGQYLATGNADGLIEIWDPNIGKLSTELDYQKENPMWHKQSVTALNFNKDSNMICSGDISGNIKLHKIANGKCLREFPFIHTNSVTSLVFTKDNSQIISGSLDSTIKILGLKAGKIIHELGSHNSFINDLQIDLKSDKVYSASSDGLVKCWDVKTYDLLSTIKPPTTNLDISINNILIFPNLSNTLIISNKSNTIYMMNINGEILKYFTTEKNKNIIYTSLSHDSEWLYAVDEDNILYTFSIQDNVIRNFMKIHDKDVIAIVHSPIKKILVSYSLDGIMKIFN